MNWSIRRKRRYHRFYQYQSSPLLWNDFEWNKQKKWRGGGWDWTVVINYGPVCLDGMATPVFVCKSLFFFLFSIFHTLICCKNVSIAAQKVDQLDLRGLYLSLILTTYNVKANFYWKWKSNDFQRIRWWRLYVLSGPVSVQIG